MSSISGVVIGAAILTILPELFREFSEYRMIAYALALSSLLFGDDQVDAARAEGVDEGTYFARCQGIEKVLVDIKVEHHVNAIAFIAKILLGFLGLYVGFAQ